MNWKREIAKLRDDAYAVHTPTSAVTGMGAREVARVLSGVTAIVARKHGVEAMQRACAELALDDRAWSSSLAVIPRGLDGIVDPAIELIAVVSRGMIACSSVKDVRAALAFWASESDPAVWQSIVGLAA